MSDLFIHLDAAYPVLEHCPRWVIAFSGGMDSCVLVDLCQRYLDPAVAATRTRVPGRHELVLLHVDHGLQPQSGQWDEWCRQHAAQLGLAYASQRVVVRNTASTEQAAREARYAAFAAFLRPGDALLMAHHADDQAETLLLRLLRGAGPAGLAAIPQQRALGDGILYRPLLAALRSDLQAWAETHQLGWIDDPSNEDRQFDRNYLRHEVMPAIAARWPAYQHSLARVAAWQAQSAELLAALGREDLARLEQPHNDYAGYCAAVSVAGLRSLGTARADNALRCWLRSQTGQPPSAEQFQQISRSLLAKEVEGNPRYLQSDPDDSWCLQRFAGYLYLLRPAPLAAQVFNLAWQPEQDPLLVLPAAGSLQAEAVCGEGLRRLPGLRVCSRQGGERCRPAGRGHSQSLKKLLQEQNVPPWLRDRLPLIYHGDELVAVADLWVCAGYQADGSAPGWRLQWRPGVPGPD